MEELTSCPFCGSMRVNVCQTNAHAIWIECANDECGAQTGSRQTLRGAIRRWNNRTLAAATATVVENDHEDFITRNFRKYKTRQLATSRR
jgi:hypothetical protein